MENLLAQFAFGLVALPHVHPLSNDEILSTDHTWRANSLVCPFNKGVHALKFFFTNKKTWSKAFRILRPSLCTLLRAPSVEKMVDDANRKGGKKLSTLDTSGRVQTTTPPILAVEELR